MAMNNRLGLVGRFGWARVCSLAAMGALLACADSLPGQTPGGSSPETSTETGNPPVIDAKLVSIMVGDESARVVGKAGAVTPGGIEVEVTSETGGAVTTADVAADGSFDVDLGPGVDPDALIRVRAVGADTGSSATVTVSPAEASQPSDDADGDRCSSELSAIESQLGDVGRRVGLSCETTYDCGRGGPVNGEDAARCHYWQCGGPVVSHAGYRALAPEVRAIHEDRCTPFNADGCPPPITDCGGSRYEAVACVDGQCRDCSRPGACPDTACDPCETPDITWNTFGPRPNTFSLTDCSTLTVETPSVTCRDTLSCVPIEAEVMTTAATLQNALGHPDVAAALAAGSAFNLDGGSSRMVQTGEGSFRIGNGDCDGGCEVLPPGVTALLGALDSIAQEHASCGCRGFDEREACEAAGCHPVMAPRYDEQQDCFESPIFAICHEQPPEPLGCPAVSITLQGPDGSCWNNDVGCWFPADWPLGCGNQAAGRCGAP